MTARVPAGLRLRFNLRLAAVKAVRRSRRSLARSTLVWGLIAFVLATVGLAGLLETVKPEWRDPEYGVRLHQLRKWRTEAPDRPLVVFFGSSRTQMGIAPAAMGFPDEPGSPVVYNFGYRAGHPLRAWFQLRRLLDDGMKPDCVILQLASIELTSSDQSQQIKDVWAGRLNVADFQRLKRYESDLGPAVQSWAARRAAAWSESRKPILSDLLPDWQPDEQRAGLYWERLDRYGFAPHHIQNVTDAQHQSNLRRTYGIHSAMFEGRPLNELADRAVHDLVARCRAEGIAVALYWAPESVTYRGWYSAAAKEAESAYHQRLVTELGVTIFPAPVNMPDTDFIDGFHLMRHGAEKYSRWLAETHLKPWLAQHGQ